VSEEHGVPGGRDEEARRARSDEEPGSAGEEGPGDAARDEEPGDEEPGDAAPDEGRESAYELLQRGTALMRGRHHAQAAVVLERADRIEPGKGSIVEALARAYYNSGQHERAEQAFRRLLEIDPSAAYGHFGLGQSLKQLGRRDEARTHLRLAVALAPGSNLYRAALTRLGPG
jgi:tetratricopeptide (TPR) repeat protein